MSSIRLIISFLIGASASWAGAAGSSRSAQGLELLVPYNSVPLIEESGRSCSLQIRDPAGSEPDDLGGLSAPMRKFILRWHGSRPLRLESLRITFTGEGIGRAGRQVITLTGEDLAYLWWGRPEAQEISARSEASTVSGCNFVVGGVVVDTRATRLGDGTVTVSAATETVDGHRLPVVASDDFSFSYYKLDLPTPSPTPLPTPTP